MVTSRAKIVNIQSPQKEAALQETALFLSRMETREFGKPRTLSHRLALIESGGQRPLSFWHDIPLYGTHSLLSCVCATPAGTCAQYEIATDEPYNPLRVVSAGGLGLDMPVESISASSTEASENTRMKAQPLSGWQKVRTRLMNCQHPVCYPGNVPWNVAYLPQTLTPSPRDCKLIGRPVEVVEVGADKLRRSGETYMVKPLGAYCVEVPGQVPSWKIIAIAEDDALTPLLNDTCDIQAILPGLLDDIRSWLQVASGQSKRGVKSGRVTISHRPAMLSYTLSKIVECHQAWCHVPHRRDWLHSFSDAESNITASYFEEMWKPYMKPGAELRSVPLSISSPEASLQFDLDWFEGTTPCSSEHPPLASPAAAKLPPLGKKSTLTKSKKGLVSLWSSLLHREKELYGVDLEHPAASPKLRKGVADVVSIGPQRMTAKDLPSPVLASKLPVSVQNSSQSITSLPRTLARSASVRIAARDKYVQARNTFLDLV